MGNDRNTDRNTRRTFGFDPFFFVDGWRSDVGGGGGGGVDDEDDDCELLLGFVSPITGRQEPAKGENHSSEREKKKR